MSKIIHYKYDLDDFPELSADQKAGLKVLKNMLADQIGFLVSNN